MVSDGLELTEGEAKGRLEVDDDDAIAARAQSLKMLLTSRYSKSPKTNKRNKQGRGKEGGYTAGSTHPSQISNRLRGSVLTRRLSAWSCAVDRGGPLLQCLRERPVSTTMNKCAD